MFLVWSGFLYGQLCNTALLVTVTLGLTLSDLPLTTVPVYNHQKRVSSAGGLVWRACEIGRVRGGLPQRRERGGNGKLTCFMSMVHAI